MQKAKWKAEKKAENNYKRQRASAKHKEQNTEGVSRQERK